MLDSRMIAASLVLAALLRGPALAADDGSFAPGGTAIDHSTEQFHDLKIVMDLKAVSPASINFGSIVAGRIMKQKGTQLVVVVEGPAINVFAKKDYIDHQGIVDSWVKLVKAGVRVEYCGNSVHGAGLKPADMTGLSSAHPAVVNLGAFPTLAHYQTLGYKPIVVELLDK
ncbi:MAG: DsrE family protein [Hyphomicrobiales bacterium]|nr:DsrE family protein [Hyphomicrobiales bacterium]